MREKRRGACPCRPISDPMLLAASTLAFDALIMLKIAPATISPIPMLPRKAFATVPIAVSPSSATTSAGIGAFTIATMTNA